MKNLNIHDNDITLQVGWSGFRRVSGSTDNTNIRFENNDYDVPTTTGAWWNLNGSKTWSQWQALGHDDTGSIR